MSTFKVTNNFESIELNNLVEFSIGNLDNDHRLEQTLFMSHSDEYFVVRDKKSLKLWSLGGQGPNQIRILSSNFNETGGGTTINTSTSANTNTNTSATTGYMQWSPHDQNLLAYCSMQDGLKLLDVREKSDQPIFSRRQNLSAKSKIKWNPFIPYWLTTSSEDSLMIVDLRYNSDKAICTLETFHCNDFSWSNSNCELLLSASSNRSVSLWSLSNPGESLSTTFYTDFGGDVIKLFPSIKQLNVYHGMSLLGGLARFEVQESFLYSIIAAAPPYSDGDGDGDGSGIGIGSGRGERIRGIEASLYCRDFEAVYQSLLDYSNCETSSNFEELQYMANQTIQTPLITSDQWSLECLGETCLNFKDDISKFSRVCPPGFDSTTLESKNGKMKEAIELVRLKVKVLESIQKCDAEGLVGMLGGILHALQNNASFLNLEILLKVIWLSSRWNRLEALKFGRQLLDNSRKLDNETCQIVHYLLFPTIFDKEAADLAKFDKNQTQHPNPSCTVNNPNGKVQGKMKSLDPMISPIPIDQPNQAMGGNRENKETKETREANEDKEKFKQNDLLNLPVTTSTLSTMTLSKIFKALKSAKQAASMVELEILFESASDDANENDDGDGSLHGLDDFHGGDDRSSIIIKEMSSDRRTISAKTIFSFLETLIEKSQMDIYFLHFGKYTSSVGMQGQSEFGKALLEHMDKKVLPKLKYILAQAIDTQRPSLVVRAVLLIVIIVNGVRPLPESLEPFLLDRLKRLVRAMSNEDYHSMQGYSQLVSLVQSLSIPIGEEEDGIWKEIFRLQSRLDQSCPMNC